MKSIIDYIIEYKTVASHNSEKSIGDPDKINHYFMQGFTSMKFGDKTAYPFIYNKKNNKIVFGKCGNTHPQLLRELSNVIKKELDILDVNSIQQLRYCCGMDDDKKEIDNWYSKNKQWVDNIICGRIWNGIKINE